MTDLWFFTDAEDVSAPDRLRGLTVGALVHMTDELATFLRETADYIEEMERERNERFQDAREVYVARSGGRVVNARLQWTLHEGGRP